MPIANIIRERRRELGLTQEQVAQSLGVSAPAVNKWERGASYPDITIIPPLARLLQTDANTLLSFEADLDEEANLSIQREVDRLVREEGYAAGFAYAQEQLRLYPASDELAIVLTQYLDGALTLFQVDGPDLYRPTLDKAYERLSQSALPEAREQACGMLIARAMQEGRYEDAQRLLDTILQPQIDREERQAILLMRQGRDEEAARRWEARLIRISADLMGAINSIIEIALRAGRVDDAQACARRAQAAFEALDQPGWMRFAPSLTVAVARQDACETLDLLEQMMASLHGGDTDVLKSPLYRYGGFNDLVQLTSQMGAVMLAGVQADEEYAFLREAPGYGAFLKKWDAR